jgi:hypothetical protein
LQNFTHLTNTMEMLPESSPASGEVSVFKCKLIMEIRHEYVGLHVARITSRRPATE